MWKPEPHTLRWPVALDDGQTLKELPLRPILHGEHYLILDELDEKKAARVESSDPMEDSEFDELAFIGLATLATGLSEGDIQKLKRPDFNGLAKRVLQMVSLTSAHFLTAEQLRASEKDNPVLLLPLKATDGVTYSSIELEVPDLQASRMMRKIKGQRERAEFITAKCTGLIVHDLNQITVPDWNALQERIQHFLNQTADFFPQATSTS